MINFSKTFLTMTGALALATMPAFAQQAEKSIQSDKDLHKNTSIKISFGLGGVKADSSLNKASVMGVNIGADAEHKLSENLNVKISGGMNVQTGSSTTARENNIYKPGNSNYLKEAKISYTPFNIIDLEAGVINQSNLDAPLLVSSKGFIAAKEGLNYKILDTKISLFAMQSIPNNRNLSQRIDVEEDGDPRFFTETLKIDQILYIGELSLSATHFAYSDISNAVAYESILLGNSGSPINKGNGVLNSEYQGWHLGANYQVSLNKNLVLKTKFNHLSNTAIKENNTGHIAALGLSYTSGAHNYYGELANFKIESDASIAYYNSSKYGLANKEGNKVLLGYANSESNLNVTAEAIQNKEINENIYQSDETIFILSLRKLYDLF